MDGTASDSHRCTPPGTFAIDPDVAAQIDQIDQILPQTQCRQCGFNGCRPYAHAIVLEGIAINRCPPGGTQVINRLAALTDQIAIPLDPKCGVEGPRQIAKIRSDLCIGCTLCIQACPVDAIAGAVKRLHAVIPELCTGCRLCIPPCPVDCIEMVQPALAQSTWGPRDAEAARTRHKRRAERLAQGNLERQPPRAEKEPFAQTIADSAVDSNAVHDRKRAVIEAAVARARARLALGVPNTSRSGDLPVHPTDETR